MSKPYENFHQAESLTQVEKSIGLIAAKIDLAGIASARKGTRFSRWPQPPNQKASD